MSALARQHDLNSNLLFRWRRKLAGTAPVPQAALHPVRIVPEEAGDVPALPARVPSLAMGARPTSPAQSVGSLEIALPGGVRVTVHGQADPALVTAALAAVLQGTRRR